MTRILFNLIVLALVSCRHGTPLSVLSDHPFLRVGPNLSPRIVGGQSANIEDYPYQVSIMFDGKHGCGGSILTTKFVLTAAHCFVGESRISHITIRVGSSYRTSGGQIVKVKSITSHPSFKVKTLDYDVAVVELASKLTLGTGVALIQLPSSSSRIVNGQQSVATGWGFTSNDGGLASQLQAVTLPLITTKTCQTYGNHYCTDISCRMICAGSEAKDACSGDSGGPLVSNGVQVGIVSWGKICGQASTPGVFTKVTSVLSFINGVIH